MEEEKPEIDDLQKRVTALENSVSDLDSWVKSLKNRVECIEKILKDAKLT